MALPRRLFLSIVVASTLSLLLLDRQQRLVDIATAYTRGASIKYIGAVVDDEKPLSPLSALIGDNDVDIKQDVDGGDGYLLAASFTKAGKPPDNTPAVKAYGKLAPAFDPIRVMGEKGDVAKAKAAWEAASVLFANYLQEVELPGVLSDPMYQ
jgi:hypothetical protein